MGLGSWMHRKLARRRPDHRAPTPDGGRVRDARREAMYAEAVLAVTVRNDPAVTAREVRAARLHQDLNLGPAVARIMRQRPSW